MNRPGSGPLRDLLMHPHAVQLQEVKSAQTALQIVAMLCFQEGVALTAQAAAAKRRTSECSRGSGTAVAVDRALEGLLHWLDLVILGLSHCFPMVPRFMLLSNLPAKKLAGKLQSFGQTHPLVPQLLLLSPLLGWLDLVLLSLGHCHPMVPRLLLLDPLLHLWNLVLSHLLGLK